MWLLWTILSGGETVIVDLGVKWHKKPQEHDYPAAEEFLTLFLPSNYAKTLVKKLKDKDMTSYYAKDILRVSQLPALGEDNRHVKHNLLKMKKGEELSPILLVKDATSKKVFIVDGYHRLCAVYHYNEDIRIPCKIVSMN